MPADSIATVNSLPADAGGRYGPTLEGKFNCLMLIGERVLDIRLHMDDTGPIAAGQAARVPITFPDREYAKKYRSVGKTFSLRVVNRIGTGMIENATFLKDVGAT